MKRLKLPRVYTILDTEALEARGIGLETAAAAMLEGRAGILQIRHKAHWSRDRFESARAVARLCGAAGAILVVNDRADFAMLLEAGLHVGQDDLAPRDARLLMGPRRRCSVSPATMSRNSCEAAASRWITWPSGRCSPLPPSAIPIRWLA